MSSKAAVDTVDYKTLLEYDLPQELADLRGRALDKHRSDTGYTVPTMQEIDTKTWLLQNGDKDWLGWRARRTAARLHEMPIEIHPEEYIVGRPLLREQNTAEKQRSQELRAAYSEIPPFPGGDAGHFHPDYEKLFAVGIGGVLEEIDICRRQADTEDQARFYNACTVAMGGMSEYCRRTGLACEESIAGGMLTAAQGKRLTRLSEICARISLEAPETFEEAIQLMFLTLIGLWFGEDHHLTSPGRIDRVLRPFYEKDIAEGRICATDALDLICCLYIQLNLILYPGSAVAVMVGGKVNETDDGTNDLTYLALAARYLTRLVYPTVGLAWNESTPPAISDFAERILAEGIGDPAFFNDDLIAAGLRDHGVSMEDSRNYMNSTCVEIKPVGTSHIWVTAPYFNCPQALLDVLESLDQDMLEKTSYDDLTDLVKKRIGNEVEQAADDLDEIWRQRSVTGGFPLASCLIRDCLATGRDFDSGGARYNWVENSFVGLANLADSMSVIRHFVFDRKEYSLEDFRRIVQSDFNGYESLLRRIPVEVPAYGNSDRGSDSVAAKWAEFMADTTERHTVGGHRYVPGFFCWIMHERFGRETGSTPDGRIAGFPLSDGAGAAQGREYNGPTASILSTTSWDHRRALGGLVHNLKLSANVVNGSQGRMALRSLVEAYMRRGGFEIQINVVSSETLIKAQADPDRYRDLLVRVAGYSDYFVHLPPKMQEEVMRRTEHSLVGV